MKARLSHEVFQDILDNFKRKPKPKKYVILVTESYTPVDFLAARYSLDVKTNGIRGRVVAGVDGLLPNEVSGYVQRYMNDFGIKREDVHFKPISKKRGLTT